MLLLASLRSLRGLRAKNAATYFLWRGYGGPSANWFVSKIVCMVFTVETTETKMETKAFPSLKCPSQLNNLKLTGNERVFGLSGRKNAFRCLFFTGVTALPCRPFWHPSPNFHLLSASGLLLARGVFGKKA
jgi:hypothetical protein